MSGGYWATQSGFPLAADGYGLLRGDALIYRSAFQAVGRGWYKGPPGAMVEVPNGPPARRMALECLECIVLDTSGFGGHDGVDGACSVLNGTCFLALSCLQTFW